MAVNREKLIIVGLGCNARLAYSFINDYDLFDVIGFAVNQEYKNIDSYMELPVYAIEELDKCIDKDKTKLFIALLWNNLNADRKKLFIELKNRGYKLANLISPRASIRSEINGENVWIHDFVTIQENVAIGNNVAIMAYSLVGNHASLGNHCFLGAKSTVAGGSKIGEQTFVGINCTVFDDTKVGNKCILGACTAVKRNVPDFTLYKTSSDDIVMKQYDEDVIESKLQSKKNKR